MDEGTRTFVWFFAIVVITVVFNCIYAVQAVVLSSFVRLRLFLLASLLLIVRISVEFFGRQEVCSGAPFFAVCSTFFALDCALFVIQVGMAFYLQSDITWRRYKAIGSSVDQRDVYSMYEAFTACLSLDLQLSLIVLVTGFAFISTSRIWLVILNVVVLLLDLVWHWLGSTGMRQQDMCRLAGFWALSVVQPAFIGLLLVLATLEEDDLSSADNGGGGDGPQPGNSTLLTEAHAGSHGLGNATGRFSAKLGSPSRWLESPEE